MKKEEQEAVSDYSDMNNQCQQRSGEKRGAAQQPTRAGPSGAAAGVRHIQFHGPTSTTATPADGCWAPTVVRDRLPIAAGTAPPPPIEDFVSVFDLSDEESTDKTSAVRKPLTNSSSRPPPPPPSRGDLAYMTVEDDEDEKDEEPADKRRNVRTLAESHPRLGIAPCVENVSDEQPTEKTRTDPAVVEWKSMFSSSSKPGILPNPDSFMELLDAEANLLNMSTENLILLLLSEEQRRSRLPAEDSSPTSSYSTTNEAILMPHATHESLQPTPQPMLQAPSGEPLSQRQPISQSIPEVPLSQRQPVLQPMPRAPSVPLPVRNAGVEDFISLLGVEPSEGAPMFEQARTGSTYAKPKQSSEGRVWTRQTQHQQEHGRTGELPDGEHYSMDLDLSTKGQHGQAIAAPQGPPPLGPAHTEVGQTTVWTSGHGGPRAPRAGEQPAANERPWTMRSYDDKHHWYRDQHAQQQQSNGGRPPVLQQSNGPRPPVLQQSNGPRPQVVQQTNGARPPVLQQSNGFRPQVVQQTHGARPQVLQQTNYVRPPPMMGQRPPTPRPGTEAGAFVHPFLTPPAVAPAHGKTVARNLKRKSRNSK